MKSMFDDLQEHEGNQKIVSVGNGEIEVRNTKTVPINFRLKVELKPKLDKLVEYFKVNDRSKALNLMIERFDDMKSDKIRAIREVHEILARKGISKEEL